MLSARQALREATAPLHEQVDRIFARFSLTDATSYAHCLSAHARVVPTAERLIADALGPTELPPRAPLLADDLADLGQPMPPPEDMPPLRDRAAVWGLLYVLEGSRLGGAMLARQVALDLPRRYLSAGHAAGSWTRFQEAMEAQAQPFGNAWLTLALNGAQIGFARFERAARQELGLPFET